MNTISIFTPSHDSRFMQDAYESLKAQALPAGWNLEWLILWNNGAEPLAFDDPRVRSHVVWKAPEFVGALKRAACEQCTGSILVELDHDDRLLPNALYEIIKAFESPEIGFVYTNTVHAVLNGSAPRYQKAQRFSEVFGWKYREVEVDGITLDEHISFEPTPEAVSRIWFAPNHARAFRRSVYEQVGGYNKEMRVLDDLDLMARMFLKTKFKHLDFPGYLYVVHDIGTPNQNTWLRFNDEIQQNVMRLYDQYIQPLAERWSEMTGLRKVELGGRMAAKAGYETVDLKDADICCDLNQRWPFEDNSVGVIRAFDIFEHLRDTVHTMKEVYRVLAPGGFCFAQCPSTDGRGAWSDPTHVAFFNERTFLYFTTARLNKYVECPVRFQALRLLTTEKDAEQVCWTRADLLSLKDGYQPCGVVEI